ncbi:MAG: histidine phosphatase family protein [Anaerolineales bacterium]|nr:histidine phosphatase family protein [Anaerolineales bacterium]
MSTNPIELALVRHEQSIGNIEKTWMGARTDSKLSELGRRQAEATGIYLKRFTPQIRAIYTSPLSRARLTADIISKHVGVPVKAMQSLIEVDMGDLEGKTSDEVLRSYPDILSFLEPDATTPIPGGESAAAVAQRVSEALLQIAQNQAPSEKTVVVSHQGAIMIGLSALLEDKSSVMNYQLSNCGVTWISFGSRPEIIELDHIEHLTSAGINTRPWDPRSDL